MLDLPKAILLSALVLAASLVFVSIGGLGRYDLVTNERGMAYRINRATGKLWLCTPSECRQIPDQVSQLDLSKL